MLSGVALLPSWTVMGEAARRAQASASIKAARQFL
jgi:hypothetical protein